MRALSSAIRASFAASSLVVVTAERELTGTRPDISAENTKIVDKIAGMPQNFI